MTRELSGPEIDALHYELLAREIIAAAENLPPFPDIAWRIMALLKEMAPVREIEKLISFDPAIAARIMRLAGSAYFGRRYHIQSLKEAIVLLGEKRIIQAVLAACANAYFIRGVSRDERELWEHSVSTALISEIAARHVNYRGIFTLYTAALLHDIGKTILDLYCKIYLQSSLRDVRAEREVVKSERRALGIDHQELGAIIARKWKFPPEITSAIEHHHNPERAGQHRELASLVCLADKLALSFSKNEKIDPESDPILWQFKITRGTLNSFKNELQTGLTGLLQALGG